MSKVTMPEPFGWLSDSLMNGGLAFSKTAPHTNNTFITNSTCAVYRDFQLKQYAAAMVRSALNAVEPSELERDLKEDVEVLRGAVRILITLAEVLAQESGADLTRTMIHLKSGEKECKPVSVRRFIDEFRAAIAAGIENDHLCKERHASAEGLAGDVRRNDGL